MAFKKIDHFYEQKRKAAQEVPFLSEITDTDFDVVVESSWPLTQVYVSSKGLLVITAMFKTFVFNKSSLYKALINEIENAIKTNTAIESIAVFVNKNKTVTYGADDVYQQIWTKNEKNYYATLVSIDGETVEKDEEDIPF